MIRFSSLTAEELAILAASVFADFRAYQVPSDWKKQLGIHPDVIQPEPERRLGKPKGEKLDSMR